MLTINLETENPSKNGDRSIVTFVFFSDLISLFSTLFFSFYFNKLRFYCFHINFFQSNKYSIYNRCDYCPSSTREISNTTARLERSTTTKTQIRLSRCIPIRPAANQCIYTKKSGEEHSILDKLCFLYIYICMHIFEAVHACSRN